MRTDATANRAALVAAARALVARDGADVALTAVAAEAGVGIATLYRHFPTRADLVDAIAADVRDSVLGLIAAHRDAVRDDAERGWPALVRALAALRPGALIPQLAAHLLADDTSTDVVALRGVILTALDEVLTLAKDAGVVRPDVAAGQVQLGLASITRPLPDSPVIELDGHEEWLVEVFLRGLRP